MKRQKEKRQRDWKNCVWMGLLMILVAGRVQSQPSGIDPLDLLEGGSKYYRGLKENLYKTDEFLNEIEDPKSRRAYYRVFFNGQNFPQTVGYYMKKESGDERVEKTELVQQVNLGLRPYYTIKYEYNQEDETLVRTKYYKDYHGRMVEYYLYHWDFKTRRLKKLEIFEKARSLNEQRLKSYYIMEWDSEGGLEGLNYYDRGRMVVERYQFKKGLDWAKELKSEYPEYGIGNHQVKIEYLERYDRYKKRGKKEREYHMEFKRSGENLLVEKYNQDGILVFEKLYQGLGGMEEEGLDRGGMEEGMGEGMGEGMEEGLGEGMEEGLGEGVLGLDEEDGVE